jgi:hypothetical protein
MGSDRSWFSLAFTASKPPPRPSSRFPPEPPCLEGADEGTSLNPAPWLDGGSLSQENLWDIPQHVPTGSQGRLHKCPHPNCNACFTTLAGRDSHWDQVCSKVPGNLGAADAIFNLSAPSPENGRNGYVVASEWVKAETCAILTRWRIRLNLSDTQMKTVKEDVTRLMDLRTRLVQLKLADGGCNSESPSVSLAQAPPPCMHQSRQERTWVCREYNLKPLRSPCACLGTVQEILAAALGSPWRGLEDPHAEAGMRGLLYGSIKPHTR